MSSSVDRYDYTDSFQAELRPGDRRSPEQLARAVFEDAPPPVRWFLWVGWRTVLGLRLGPRHSPEHVLGWTLTERSSDAVTLDLRSRFLTARLVFQIHEARASQATFVRYDRPIAALVWPPVSILHRQIVPRCLQRAAGRPDTA